MARGFIVRTIISTPSWQGPVASGSLLVKIKVTEPVAMSATEGLYVVANKEASSKVPVPKRLQEDTVALPPMLPEIS